MPKTPKNSTQSEPEYLVAVILTDKDRNIQWVNSDFTAITGYALSEVIGKKPGQLLQGKNTEAEAVERIRKALSKEESIKDQLTNYRKNGEEYPCSLVIHPVHNPSGELTNFIAFEVDAAKTQDEHLSMMQIKYANSSLTEQQRIKIYEDLLAYMDRVKPYLNPRLNLHSIASDLNTNTNYLSQVVNYQTGCNLVQFINRYRVEEAKKRITDQHLRHLNTFAVAFECGFDNRSTFYKVFREVVGMTPKQYIQSHEE